MRMQASEIRRARELASPTIRQILRKRRNAIKHKKASILAELNQDLIKVVKAAIMIGCDAAELAANTTQHPEDTRALEAIVVRVSKELER